MEVPTGDWTAQVRTLEVRLAASQQALANQRLVFEARSRRDAAEAQRLRQSVEERLALQVRLARPPVFPVVSNFPPKIL